MLKDIGTENRVEGVIVERQALDVLEVEPYVRPSGDVDTYIRCRAQSIPERRLVAADIQNGSAQIGGEPARHEPAPVLTRGEHNVRGRQWHCPTPHEASSAVVAPGCCPHRRWWAAEVEGQTTLATDTSRTPPSNDQRAARGESRESIASFAA